jgi:glycosyltransferase involved in cell wall biosynthesis
MVASLTSRTKKHPLFIAAAALLNRVPNVEFRIYGHDPSAAGAGTGDHYSASLRTLVHDLGLTHHLRFVGFVADPAQIMSQIDILVHPADNESFGRIVVEAMAAGLPVVGVRGGGVGEIVVDEQTGLVASPDDAGGLAERIERLIRDASLRARLGAAGRRRAELNYSLESCAAGVLRVYEEAMQRPLGVDREATRP